MKIAFDATVLHGRKSGVGYYCDELLRSMTSIDNETSFYVFSHQPLSPDQVPAAPNVRLSGSGFCPIRALYLHALLPKLIREENPDLCHYTNFLAPIVSDRPYVVTIHDMGLESLRASHPLVKRLYTRRLVPHVARRARLIITNSEYSKWEIVRYLGIPEQRIRVTPLAASHVFHPVDEAGQREVLGRHGVAQPYFLYVGNLEPRKNLARLLEAFARLKNLDCQLAVVGNRWYRGGEVEQTCNALGLSGRVQFLGYVPRADLPALYSGAQALVYPSLLEGFGLPVIEAMACGAPVITSNNSSMREIGEGAARLVDPQRVDAVRDAMADIANDARYRQTLSNSGLKRARRFSWERTASLTLEAYREALEMRPAYRPLKTLFEPVQSVHPSPVPEVAHDAVCRTLHYSALFQYPLRMDELRERLFDIAIDSRSFSRLMRSLDVPCHGEFYTLDAEFVGIRAFREQISDQAIRDVEPALTTLASLPFIRMIAFSGATAHRNMIGAEDIDLFMVVRRGRLWGTFLMAMLWAKYKGLRDRLCMNYLVADNGLPLYEHDAFTAQQVASLKPIYGKEMYDQLIEVNPFVSHHFPNFMPARHRETYPEIRPSGLKRIAETMLNFGPAQLLEPLARWVLGRYLRVKVEQAAREGECDVVADSRRLKLHLKSHKGTILSQTAVSFSPIHAHEHRQLKEGHRH